MAQMFHNKHYSFHCHLYLIRQSKIIDFFAQTVSVSTMMIQSLVLYIVVALVYVCMLTSYEVLRLHS